MQRAVPRLRFCLTRAASSSAPKDHWDALDMSGHSLASLFSDAATVPKNDDEGKSLKTRLLERSACDVFLQPHERPPALSDQPSLDDNPYAHLEAARLRIRERFERKFLRPEIPSVLEAVKHAAPPPPPPDLTGPARERLRARFRAKFPDAEPTRGPENASTDFSPPDYSVAARHRLRDRYLAKFA